MYIENLAKKAKLASKELARIGTKDKNAALEEICKSLIDNAEYILSENKKDIEKAKEKGTSDAMIDRLTLTYERIEQMVKFFEDNKFQVIYAAPPEKIDSIGSHINSTISLCMKGKYTWAVEGLVKLDEFKTE